MNASVASPPAVYETIIPRLADEGMPVSAICRAVQLPRELVTEVLTAAVGDGTLIEIPPADWPTSTTRSNRAPAVSNITREDTVFKRASTVFKMSRQQAYVFATLVRHRDVVTKETLLNAARSIKENTALKLVDVLVCKIRAKLRPFNIDDDPDPVKAKKEAGIETMWAVGFQLKPRAREIVLKLLHAGPQAPEALQ